jgi:hypothetical protein
MKIMSKYTLLIKEYSYISLIKKQILIIILFYIVKVTFYIWNYKKRI